MFSFKNVVVLNDIICLTTHKNYAQYPNDTIAPIYRLINNQWEPCTNQKLIPGEYVYEWSHNFKKLLLATRSINANGDTLCKVFLYDPESNRLNVVENHNLTDHYISTLTLSDDNEIIYATIKHELVILKNGLQRWSSKQFKNITALLYTDSTLVVATKYDGVYLVNDFSADSIIKDTSKIADSSNVVLPTAPEAETVIELDVQYPMPNPATSTISIVFADGTNKRVTLLPIIAMDATGKYWELSVRSVLQNEGTRTITLDVEALSNGNYYVKHAALGTFSFTILR